MRQQIYRILVAVRSRRGAPLTLVEQPRWLGTPLAGPLCARCGLPCISQGRCGDVDCCEGRIPPLRQGGPR